MCVIAFVTFMKPFSLFLLFFFSSFNVTLRATTVRNPIVYYFVNNSRNGILRSQIILYIFEILFCEQSGMRCNFVHLALEREKLISKFINLKLNFPCI